jgi:hypothetical protein
MTSARLWTDDHVGTEPTSASASRITSGGASMTISRDACTATEIKLALPTTPQGYFGASDGIRTRVYGFAGRCLAAQPHPHKAYRASADRRRATVLLDAIAMSANRNV